MTKRSKSSTIDFTRITETHRRHIDRVVEIGARIGIDQQKQHQDILRAMTRSLDVALEAMADADRAKLFAALTDAATASDGRKIAQHPLCEVRQDVMPSRKAVGVSASSSRENSDCA